MSDTLFSNVRIFDGTGTSLFPEEVRVSGERITGVAKGDGRLPREGAAIIDGEGRTLMPGMVESHGHLTWPLSINAPSTR